MWQAGGTYGAVGRLGNQEYKGYLQIRMGLGSGTGHGKRKGHGTKYFNIALEKRQVCSEKKCFGKRVSKLVKSALIRARERGRHSCKSELR